jgi:hypothetical protein
MFRRAFDAVGGIKDAKPTKIGRKKSMLRK